MKVGGFQEGKSLMIDMGSFTSSDDIIITISFCKLANWRGWRIWVLKYNCYAALYDDRTELKRQYK